MKLVIDTNIFFAGLYYESYYTPIVYHLYHKRANVLISNSILLEYEEVLHRRYPPSALTDFFEFIHHSENVIFVNPAYRFRLPVVDKSDQKFVDCAICGGADFLITNDKHFNILKDVQFPKLQIIKAEIFIEKYIDIPKK